MVKAHLLDLREALGDIVAAQPVRARVRPEIAASWQRSISAHLRPDRFDVPYDPDAGDAERLGHAARPILDHLGSDISSTGMCLVLTDSHGRIIERLVGDGSLRPRLDGIRLAPGFRYEEDDIGTNAIGTALGEGVPSFVVGGEHFADALTGMACAAAPILHPTTGSILGAVDLTCSAEQSQSLMLAVVKHAAFDIGRELVGAEPPDDRVLRERFLRARRGARGGALVGLNGRVMYTNAPAVTLLEGIDRALLWDVVSAAMVDRPGLPIEVPLASGRVGTISSEPVFDGPALAGALLRVRPQPTTSPREPWAVHRRPAFGWDSLTETEVCVTERVSGGLTNREIAAQLYMSAHTVGFHLRQIFRKLDINSRVDLTRQYVEQIGDAPPSTARQSRRTRLLERVMRAGSVTAETRRKRRGGAADAVPPEGRLHGNRPTRQDRPEGVADRVRRVATRRRVGISADRRSRRCHSPRPHARRQHLRHCAGLRLRYVGAVARRRAARPPRSFTRRRRDRYQRRSAQHPGRAGSRLQPGRAASGRRREPRRTRRRVPRSLSDPLPDPAVPYPETAGALQELVDAGKIRHIGVSNFDTDQIAEFARTRPVETLQPPYHLFRQDAARDLLPYCAQHGIGVLAYGPLAHGLLSGQLRKDTTFAPDDWRSSSPIFRGEPFVHNLEAVRRLQSIAADLGATVSQLAVAWVLANPAVDVAIVGTRNADHVADAVTAADLVLSAEDVSRIDDVMTDAAPVGGPSPEAMP